MSPPDTPPDTETRRTVCARCERPDPVCYCSTLCRLDTTSRIVILQHPREQGNPIGTAHMAHLCLPRSSVHVGVDWDGGEVLQEACADPARPAVLLYPGPHARDILREPPAAPVTLIVVDGTWSQARAMVRDNPGLAALPRYTFHAPESSVYRIRPQPDPAYVSTLEALMHVLGAIEGDAVRFRALLRPMRAMIDAQLAAEATRPRYRTRRRRSPRERLPKLLRDRLGDLVLVVAEANAWPHGTPERDLGDELVYWVAHRPRSGETFSFVVAPRIPLAPDIPRHTEIPPEDLHAGGPPERFLDAFSAFLRPTDVLGSWGFHALRLLAGAGGSLGHPHVDLQDAARLLENQRPGPLERYAAARSIVPEGALPRGRAGRRLGMLIGIVDAWRRLPATAPGCADSALESS